MKFKKYEHLSGFWRTIASIMERPGRLRVGLLGSIVLFGGLFGAITPVWAAPSEQVIGSIEIRGNRKIETPAIVSKLHSVVGGELDPEVVREDIRAIYSLNFFENIEALEEPDAGGVRLVFVVKEKPTVSEIVWEGLSELEESEVKELSDIRQYEVLDIQKINSTVDKLLTKYEEKGFYLADVRYDISPNEARNEVAIVFHIEENEKVRIRHINIIGNKVLSDDELKKVMQVQEAGFFSWLTGSGSYRESIFERDIANLGFYYGTQGYVRVRFGKPEVTVSPDRRWIDITFFVEEGNQYKVGKVDFSGELLFTREELLEDLQLIDGEIFNSEILRRETLRYTDKFSDLGYAFANVVPQYNVHDDTLRIDITFDVDKGQRVYIGSITVTGNTKTKDKVIRRELLIREGEIFSGTNKRLSRENVLRLGFFDNVEFHQSTSKTDPSVVNMEIRVVERSTGQLVVGAGYASGGQGFTFHAQLSQNNFLGNGQVASLSAQILTGQNLYDFNLGFTEPYLGSSLWSLGGDLFQVRRTLTSYNILGADGTPKAVPTFEEVKSGFDVRLGHPVLEFTNLFLTYKLENSYVKPESIIDRVMLPKESVDGITSSLATSLVFDKRDDRFDPRNGWYWSLSSEYAGLGGNRKYWRSRGEIKFFHPVVWDFVFRSQFRVGTIASVGGAQIPVNELFIQGGLFSLRGYENLSLGPKQRLSSDPAHLSQAAKEAGVQGREVVIGGRHEVLMNFEVEFPILKEARIRGVVFFDAGNAFNGWFQNMSPALYANYGWGFRWFTPIGPLRFEFGTPIVGGGGTQFYFTIGPPF